MQKPLLRRAFASIRDVCALAFLWTIGKLVVSEAGSASVSILAFQSMAHATLTLIVIHAYRRAIEAGPPAKRDANVNRPPPPPPAAS